MGGTPHNGLFNFTMTGVADATLNPPGTWFVSATSFLLGTPVQFGPFNPCGGGTSFSVGPWGYGDAAVGCPDVIPDFGPAYSLIGIRYNCQNWSPPSGNVQTFLAIRENGIPQEQAAANRAWMPRPMRLQELLESNRLGSEFVKARYEKRKR